jgi:hypothetical protein
MKSIAIIILSHFLILNQTTAQNWNTTPEIENTYFSSGDILKYTQIVSKTADGIGDSNFYFYNTIRDSIMWGSIGTSNCLNTSAPSWMGFMKTRTEINGVERYFNFKGDTIFINTYSSLASSWIMMRDTGNNTISATISKIDTLTIDGYLDSIKEISLQRNINGFADSAYYNNFKLIFSKTKGWLTLPDLYCFNTIPLVTQSSLSVFNTNSLFYRIPIIIGNTIKRNVDLNAKFQVGNDWIYYLRSVPAQIEYWVHDSIISSMPLGNNTYNCIIKRREFGEYIGPPFGLLIKVKRDTTFQIVTDSFYSCLVGNSPFKEQAFSGNIEVEKKPHQRYAEEYKLDTLLYGAAQMQMDYYSKEIDTSGPCPVIGIPLGTAIINNEKFNAKIGRTSFGYSYAGDPGFVPAYHFHLIYADINDEIYGTKVNVLALGLTKQNKISYQISPNPTKDLLQISMDNDGLLATISILNINGVVIKTLKAHKNNEIDVSKLPTGLYLLRLQGKEILAYDKFIKL